MAPCEHYFSTTFGSPNVVAASPSIHLCRGLLCPFLSGISSHIEILGSLVSSILATWPNQTACLICTHLMMSGQSLLSRFLIFSFILAFETFSSHLMSRICLRHFISNTAILLLSSWVRAHVSEPQSATGMKLEIR